MWKAYQLCKNGYEEDIESNAQKVALSSRFTFMKQDNSDFT